MRQYFLRWSMKCEYGFGFSEMKSTIRTNTYSLCVAWDKIWLVWFYFNFVRHLLCLAQHLEFLESSAFFVSKFLFVRMSVARPPTFIFDLVFRLSLLISKVEYSVAWNRNINKYIVHFNKHIYAYRRIYLNVWVSCVEKVIWI